jgi:hypothetical protein
MNEEEKKPEGENEAGTEPPNSTGGLVPNNLVWDTGMFNRGFWVLPEFNPFLNQDSPIIPKKESDGQPKATYNITIKQSDVINLDGIVGPEPDPKVISQIVRKFYEKFGMPTSMVQNFSNISQDAKPVSVDAIDVLMKQHEFLMEKAEAKGIKKGWVFCVPPEIIPALQAQLKPFANEVVLPVVSMANQLAGIPIYAVHTESGQMEYMPYEVALAKYGNQILPRENSPEGENED